MKKRRRRREEEEERDEVDDGEGKNEGTSKEGNDARSGQRQPARPPERTG